MGLDDRLRGAMRAGQPDGHEGLPADTLRRRARRRVWQRRTAFGSAVLAVVVAASVVVSQQSGDSSHQVAVGNGLVQAAPDAVLAVSKVARAAPGSTAVAPLTAANAQFAWDLYHQLVKESPGRNLVFSPDSISYALAMVDAGARGNTAAEIGKALHFDALPAGQLDRAFNALAQALLAPRTAEDKGRTPLQLSTTNAAWGQRGFPFEQAYLDTLARYYGAGLRLSDFTRDAERERQRINAYVDQQTKHRIPELIPAGVIDNLTRLVLVNTITFTADWRVSFATNDTTTKPFTKLDGTRVDVPMMMQNDEQSFSGYQGDHFVAASLPYEGGASMLIVVPDAGQFGSVEQKLDPALIRQIDTGLAPGVEVSLPKFDVRTHTDLPNALGALGVHDAFSPQRADLTGIAPRPADLYVSDIIHEATIHVDENGTKAAGATAAIIEASSARVVSLVVNADRPFIYLIRDDATGAILFEGRVLDPTQG